MTAGPGRPRASSRRTIEEAALELFLENGYAGTSIDDIARRAGVGRATVFSYVAAKSDLLWLDADAALDDLTGELGRGTPVRAALAAVARRIGPDRVPLAITQADVLGVRAELETSAMPRLLRLERLLRGGGRPPAPRRDARARARRALHGVESPQRRRSGHHRGVPGRTAPRSPLEPGGRARHSLARAAHPRDAQTRWYRGSPALEQQSSS